MKKLNHNEAIELIENYQLKDKIQVLVFTSEDSNCSFCNNFKNNIHGLKIAEDNNIIDLYYITLDDAYGYFKPERKFFYKYYIPWNTKKTPQDRYQLLDENAAMKEFMGWRK